MLSIRLQLFPPTSLSPSLSHTVDKTVLALLCRGRSPSACRLHRLNQNEEEGGVRGGYYYIYMLFLGGTESRSFSLGWQTHSALFRPQQALSRPIKATKKQHQDPCAFKARRLRRLIGAPGAPLIRVWPLLLSISERCLVER